MTVVTAAASVDARAGVRGVVSLSPGLALSQPVSLLSLLVGVAMWPLLEAMTSCDGVAPKRGFVYDLCFAGPHDISCGGSSALLGVRRGVDGLSRAVAREVSMISSVAAGFSSKAFRGRRLFFVLRLLLFAE